MRTFWCILLCALPVVSIAQSGAPETGPEIMGEQVVRYRDAVTTEIEEFAMLQGERDLPEGELERSEMTRVVRYTAEADTSLTQVDGPEGNLSHGLKILSVDDKRDDGRWRLFVRLPDDRQGRSFVGASANKRVNASSLTYRDLKFLQNQEVLREYTYERLPNEDAGGGRFFFVLRARPREGVNAEYAYLDLWIRPDVFFTVKIVAYDRSREPRVWKRFTITGLDRVRIDDERSVIRARRVEVVDEKEDFRTILVFSSRRVNADVDPFVFTDAYVNSRALRSFAEGR